MRAVVVVLGFVGLSLGVSRISFAEGAVFPNLKPKWGETEDDVRGRLKINHGAITLRPGLRHLSHFPKVGSRTFGCSHLFLYGSLVALSCSYTIEENGRGHGDVVADYQRAKKQLVARFGKNFDERTEFAREQDKSLPADAWNDLIKGKSLRLCVKWERPNNLVFLSTGADTMLQGELRLLLAGVSSGTMDKLGSLIRDLQGP
jgi:hypothetical protein